MRMKSSLLDVEIALSWRQIAVAVIAVLGVFTLLFAAWSATSVWSFPRFVIAVVVVIYLPGKLLLDVARLHLSAPEDLTLALLLGTVVSSLVFWGTAFLALDNLFVLWPLAASAAYLCRTAKIWSRLRHRTFLVNLSHFTLVGVITAGLLPMAVLPLYYRNLALLPEGAMSFKMLSDSVFHLSIAQELTVSVPPRAPFLAGQPLNYHYAMDLLAAMLSRTAWLSIPDLSVRFLPTLFLIETVLAVFVFSRAWLRSSWGAVITSFLVILGEDFSFIPGLLLRSRATWSVEFFGVPTTYSLYFMNPMLPALAVLFAGLFCLLRFSREHGRAWLLLTALLFASLTEYKVFSAAHVLLALAVTAVIYLLLHRDTTPLRILLLTSLLTVPLMLYTAFGTEASLRVRTRIEPLQYVPTSLARMGLLEYQVDSLSEGGPITLSTASALLLVGVPAYLLGSLGLRGIAIPQILKNLLFPKRSTFFGFFLAVLAVLGPILTLICTVTPSGYTTEAEYNNAVWFYVQSKYVIWSMATGSILSVCRGRRPAQQAMIVATALMLAIPSSAQFVARLSRSSNSVVEKSQVEAIGYLAGHCTNGEVVLAQPPMAAYLAALSPCRVPFAMPSRFNHSFVSQGELEQRRLDQNHFWDAWDRGILQTSTLERYGVSYVVPVKEDNVLLDFEDRYWIGKNASREEVVKAIHPSPGSLDITIYEISEIWHIPIEHPAESNMGNVISLLGSSASSSHAWPGATVGVTLWWRALGRMERDYTAFIHMVDQDGSLWAQEDRLLSIGGQPTSGWQPGDIARANYALMLPSDMPPGNYVIKAGLYYWQTGERLPARDGQGHRVPADAVPVETITVRAANRVEG
jgi:hypothetical protein